MNATKAAERDAQEYARAKMFYGEGAGIRRKLIEATVESRAHKDPRYARAFHEALASQDMSEHAQKAQKERKRIDRNEALSRNVKGMLNGNNKTLNTSVLVLGTVAYIAHQTGYDQKIIAKGKQVYADLKARRARKKNLRVVHNITNI